MTMSDPAGNGEQMLADFVGSQVLIQIVGADEEEIPDIPEYYGDNGLDAEALSAAHQAVQDHLVALRDARISVLGPRNGFVIREYDGSPSAILRLGTRDGLAIGIAAYLAAAKEPT